MTTPASTRPRVVVLLAAVVLALLLLLARALDARADDSSGLASPQASSAETPLIEYRVRSGDTIWAIASGHVAPGDDIRVLVEDIRTVNGLDTSVIHPGQVLLIPTGG
ncbi:MAG TPA: LysM peptidoglycan-binding domain-containing protein [Acidimicrobiia bacterium]|nr:LysM peptidoglycan-binding domain-containing protein [Acidimicrobiia bacterium]